MNKRIDFSNIGGFPFTQKTLDFMQSSYRDAIAAFSGLFENKTIIQGVVVTGSTVSDGWIFYNDELIRFVGGTIGANVVIQETTEDRIYEDGTSHSVFFTKTAQCGSIGDFPFADLKPHSPIWVSKDVKLVDCDNAYIITNFDGTGLGRNARRGWAICNGNNGTRDRGGIVSIGYDSRTFDPGTGWWDAAYNTVGNLVGEMRHQLSIAELPSHSHQVLQGNSYTGSGGAGRTGRGYDSPNTFNTEVTGSNSPHENRQKSIVTLFIQKL